MLKWSPILTAPAVKHLKHHLNL